jgi:sugar phosphate isomerase/epimerase
MTRRQALALFASALPAAGLAKPKLPLVCVSSQALAGVGYAEMGEIVKQIGFDGVDITVMPGGLVEPQQAPVDEVRALESIHGAGLEAPIITTALTTPFDPWSRTVLALAGRTGVGLFKSGVRLQSKRDVMGLVVAGREYKIALTIPVGSEEGQMGIASAQALLTGVDPEWCGLSLDASCFLPGAGMSDEKIGEAMGQVKAVAIADSAAGSARPLGKGDVAFDRLFAILARTGFSGPITVARKYKTSDEPGALSRDLEFVRQRMQVAYGSPKS